MATHSYIFQVENNLDSLDSDAVDDVIESFLDESERMGADGPYPENRHVWEGLLEKAQTRTSHNPALEALVSFLKDELTGSDDVRSR